MKTYKVAVVAPMKEALTYSANAMAEGVAEEIAIGSVVLVPLGKRICKGVVLDIQAQEKDIERVRDQEKERNQSQSTQSLTTQTHSNEKVYEIKSIVKIDPAYPPEIIKNYIPWIQWVSDYYIYPIGLVIDLLFPPLDKTTKTRSRKKSALPDVEKEIPNKMNQEQEKVFKEICNVNQLSGFSTHLLYGVTGSGKTEVYMHLFDQVLKSGKKGLFLLPEIALTPQLVSRFAKRFGNQISILHSQLTDRERTQFWWDMIEGEKNILIGARSALFCPIPNLGLIVVDEEHESSFKQDDKLKYNGRDSAIMLGKMMNCPVVLGSATPSFESWNNCIEKKFHFHQLTQRVGQISLPDIKVVDLKQSAEQSKEKKIPFWLSPELYNALLNVLEKKEQAALFLNRRGMAQSVICPSCGYTKECPNCDIKLTLHAHNHLVCHYCDYHESYKIKCPDCKEGELKPLGIGTESTEAEIKKLFPDARVARVDRDEIQNRLDLEEIIQKMENHEIDILIGTQMISKGLDFQKLKLVGLLLADIGFNLPDFRSTEKSYQLITQMSGRAGRHVKPGEEPGLVILQTYNPDHESIKYAMSGDFQEFAELELGNRKMLDYPPFGKMISLRIQSKSLKTAIEVSKKTIFRCQQLIEKTEKYQNLLILGPTESPISKIRGDFRFQILIKSTEKTLITRFVKQVLHDEKWVPSTARVIADVDPQSML